MAKRLQPDPGEPPPDWDHIVRVFVHPHRGLIAVTPPIFFPLFQMAIVGGHWALMPMQVVDLRTGVIHGVVVEYALDLDALILSARAVFDGLSAHGRPTQLVVSLRMYDTMRKAVERQNQGLGVRMPPDEDADTPLAFCDSVVTKADAISDIEFAVVVGFGTPRPELACMIRDTVILAVHSGVAIKAVEASGPALRVLADSRKRWFHGGPHGYTLAVGRQRSLPLRQRDCEHGNQNEAEITLIFNVGDSPAAPAAEGGP